MPRPITEKDYRRRVERVVAHIAEHLDEKLDTERLAEVACFSPWHFHRIYTAVAGETLAETVRRLRLRRAAFELTTASPLARVAARAGYTGLAAFSRAFKAEFGLPPTRWLARSPTVPPFQPPRTGAHPMTTPFPVEIRTLPALRLATVRHVGPYRELGRAFDTLCATAAERRLFGPAPRFVGIGWDDPSAVPAAELRADAGLVVDEATAIAPPLVEHRIPAGRFAVHVHRGPYDGLEAAYRRFFREWLPQSGEAPGNGPAFDEYLNDARTVAPADLLTAIHLPLAD